MFTIIKFNTKRAILIIIALLVTVITLIGCSNTMVGNLTAFKKLNEGEYLVCFSKEFTKPAKFVVYKQNGRIVEQGYVKDGQALHCLEPFSGNYIVTSKRTNHHFIIDSQGNISSIYLLKEKYKPDSGFGTFFTLSSNNWLLYAMNIGDFGEGYINELIYQNGLNGKKQSIDLKGCLLNSAIVFENKIYAHYFNVDDTVKHSGGIYVIDISTNLIVNKIPIYRKSLSLLQGKPIKVYNDYLILYGYNSDINPENDKKDPCLSIFNMKTNKFEKEITFEESFHPIALEIFNNKIYVIGDNAKVKMLNYKYDIINEFYLSDKVLEDKYLECGGFIDKTIINGSELHVFYRFTYDSKNIQFPGAVHVYNIETGKLKRITELRLNDEKDWWGEQIAVTLIKK
ncbi:hypothetical protein Dtox_1762 [Desulfofarcimen acetoxidans DSM 771]|uniref:Lipoprotein n=1 Tax=Desulfofarcimen acetoxidans (strain ATCC 49208 / DSM 771 / KCTC 5769 / VKM B-1644 / 5575) TaxID=485916 RepID=C8VX42_DESAS|nr:hypothetical protein [Desulfofarcimen acetoxidans]ACV62618.1 hypothetical protein Dtox_1762 [Desulfofarcimen acetoxidans DSM 771]